jgi:hypothetical protein
MTVTHHDFDLCLERRADLRRLEAYALHGELVRDNFYVQFGRMLYGWPCLW